MFSMENVNWKVVGTTIGLLLVIIGLMLVLRNKDNFCRCNSVGSRVMCEDKEEANRLYLDGSLTENNF